MKHIYIKILILVMLAFPFKNGVAQCTQLIKGLKQAERLYDDGSLTDAARKVKQLLRDAKSSSCPEQIKKANILMTKLNLFLNKDSLAEVSFKEALVLDPLYIPDTTLEPIDLWYFSRKYRTIPRRTISIDLLSGVTSVRKLNEYYTTDIGIEPSQNTEEATSYNSNYVADGFGLGARVRAGYHINSFFEIGLGVEFDQRQYGVDYYLDYSAFNDAETNVAKKVHIKERQQWWSIPLTGRVNLSRKNIVGTLYGGAEYGYLANARLTEISRGGVFEDTENNDFIVTNSRIRSNIGLIGGIGFKFRPVKLTSNYIAINLQWSRYLTPINDIENRFNYSGDDLGARKKYITELLLFKYGFMDENIELNYLQLSLSYELTKYRAVERKGVRF